MALCAGLLDVQQRLQLRLLKPDWLKSWLVPALMLTRLHRLVSLCRQWLQVKCGALPARLAGLIEQLCSELRQLLVRHNLAHCLCFHASSTQGKLTEAWDNMYNA